MHELQVRIRQCITHQHIYITNYVFHQHLRYQILTSYNQQVIINSSIYNHQRNHHHNHHQQQSPQRNKKISNSYFP